MKIALKKGTIMKLRKSVISVILSMVLCICYLQTAFASQGSNIISIKEYESAMKELYSKYGVEYEVVEENEDVILTQSLLEEQLIISEKQLRDAKNITVFEDVPSFTPYALMPYTYNKTVNVKVNSPAGMGSANFDINLKATADAQYGRFISVTSYTCVQRGAYVNFKSWRQTSKSVTMDGRHCTPYFKGELTIQYLEPRTGMTVGYTSKHTISYVFAEYN